MTVSNDNEELVVALAVDVLAGKGWLEDDPDSELLADLHRLYRANPVCQLEVRYTGELLHDLLASRPGEHLAAAFENERQETWERTLPAWTCDCGQAFKVLPGGIQVSEGDLDAMKRRGWIERAREPIPHEGRILVTLWHPRQTVGEGCDRYYTAVETFHSLPLDEPGPSQLTLFGERC